MVSRTILINVAHFLCITGLWDVRVKVYSPSKHLASSWVIVHYCLRRHCFFASVPRSLRRSSCEVRSHLKHHFQQRHTPFRESEEAEQSSEDCFPVNERFSSQGSVVFLPPWVTYLLGPRRQMYLQSTQGYFVVRTRLPNLSNWLGVLTLVKELVIWTWRKYHIFTHTHSLMMFPETAAHTSCEKEHFTVEVDLNRF